MCALLSDLAISEYDDEVCAGSVLDHAQWSIRMVTCLHQRWCGVDGR